MANMTLARDEVTGDVAFAVVADDEGFEYLWPRGTTPAFDFDDRINSLLPKGTDTSSWTVDDWSSLSVRGTGLFDFSPWQVLDGGRAKALAHAQEVVDADNDGPGLRPADAAVLSRVADTSYARAGAPDDDENEGPDADSMLLMVASALGEIDPNGPNGHILRALDGTPLPGDEDLAVVFGGS